MRLAEIKTLGRMQNGHGTIGGMRLVCLWNTKEETMYGFALQDNQEVVRTVKQFYSDPTQMYKDAKEMCLQKKHKRHLSKL